MKSNEKYNTLVEAVARELAGLEPEEDWPTNEELGGHPILGTRDDEFRSETISQARDIVELVMRYAYEWAQEA